MQYAAQRGWRSCVLNRRGHSGMPLHAPRQGQAEAGEGEQEPPPRVTFSLLGTIDDTCSMVNHLHTTHPKSFIALAGISAGSGQVVSYIGREGSKTPIGAAASLCPAWDISQSFDYLHELYPRCDAYLTAVVRDFFIERHANQAALAEHPEAVAGARAATSLVEFLEACVPLAGCRDIGHYMEWNNPMRFAFGNRT